MLIYMEILEYDTKLFLKIVLEECDFIMYSLWPCYR